MAPLFPGCDYEHWLIVMDKPGGEGATKQQMIDCYIQTLAKVVGRLIKYMTFNLIVVGYFLIFNSLIFGNINCYTHILGND